MLQSRAGTASLTLSGVTQVADRELQAVEIRHTVTGLFDRQRNPILRYLLSMGLPVPDAEDVIQDSFLALYNHLRRGRPRINLEGWTFRTAHNLGLKRRRALHRHRPAACMDSSVGSIIDRGANPEQLLDGIQRYERMCRVLRALPERDRQCLALRSEGLRYRDIAGILGISLGTVSNSISRALLRLRKAER